MATSIQPRLTSFVSSPPKKNDSVATDICFKIFVIATTVLAVAVVVIGVLALMASKGLLSHMSSVAKLSAIGEVNSYVMIGGGIALFILGILSWGYHLKKEAQS
jgi:hypothetical protein